MLTLHLSFSSPNEQSVLLSCITWHLGRNDMDNSVATNVVLRAAAHEDMQMGVETRHALLWTPVAEIDSWMVEVSLPRCSQLVLTWSQVRNCGTLSLIVIDLMVGFKSEVCTYFSLLPK